MGGGHGRARKSAKRRRRREQARRRRRRSQQVNEGQPDRGSGRVQRAVHGVERRIEREQRPHDLDHMEDADADGARWHQREERDGQREHEREQRARADLAGSARRSRRRRQRMPLRRPRSQAGSAALGPSRSCTSAVSATSNSSVTANEAMIPSASFSTSSPEAPTRPRVIRANAFSSRSSASDPATSRTVTNISVTVAATAIAKTSRSEDWPATTSLSTVIGSAIAPSSGRAKWRLSGRRGRRT